MRNQILMSALGGLMLVGVAGGDARAASAAPQVPMAQGILKDASGAVHGSFDLAQHEAVIRGTVSVTGLKPGAHGLHIHMVGRCDAPDFKTAGDHWNPDGKMHGHKNPMGPHKGDLPQVIVNAKGNGTVTFDVPGLLKDVMDADGAAVIVHATADDDKTDPSGNSGARIACGVVTVKN